VTLGFELTAQHQQLVLGQQPLIELLNPHQALADGGQHFLFQEGDFLFSIGLLAPGAAQRRDRSQRRSDDWRGLKLERTGANPTGSSSRRNGIRALLLRGSSLEFIGKHQLAVSEVVPHPEWV